MKKLIALMAILALSGCTTNGQFDAPKTWTLVGAVVVGSILASSGGNSSASGENCHWVVGPGGNTQVCR